MRSQDGLGWTRMASREEEKRRRVHVGASVQQLA